MAMPSSPTCRARSLAQATFGPSATTTDAISEMQSPDDLFRPTLTEQDDAVGFDRPWNPWSLVVLAFFFGLPGGGTLLALNFRRLGMPQAIWPVLAVVVLGTL